MKFSLTFAFVAVCIAPYRAFAVVQPSASITTRTGQIVEILHCFDISKVFALGTTGHAPVVKIVASSPARAKVVFSSVKLIDPSGSFASRNVASGNDELASSEYTFSFRDFRLSPDDVRKASCVLAALANNGGDDPNASIIIKSVSLSYDRQSGEQCGDPPPLVPDKLPVTFDQEQKEQRVQITRRVETVGGTVTITTYSTAGTSTWTAPGDGTVKVEAWGAGGGGPDDGSGGGGGGAFGGTGDINVINVTSGTGYTVVVGAGGDKVIGSPSWFINLGTVGAQGGSPGVASGAGGGGGDGTVGGGYVKYGGGNGANFASGAGGGGGSSAGYAAAGVNGSGTTGGDAPDGGGDGGTGGYASSVGGGMPPVAIPGGPGADGELGKPGGGGGGGGGGLGVKSGVGRDGQIVITFTPSGGASVYDTFIALMRSLSAPIFRLFSMMYVR